MNRKRFIQAVFGVAVLPAASACKKRKPIKGKIIGASSVIGHKLRNPEPYSVTAVTKEKIVIIGGGISGLSAARHLVKKGVEDFILLELENEVGGNAKSGINDISAFPWGAHYVPIPNNDLDAYLEFLKECDVIKAVDEKGLPVFNDAFLCFDPEERLFINGKWQDGLVPHFGLPDKDLQQITAFMKRMNDYRYAKGSDGKDAFAIPVDWSSNDTGYTILDNSTMKQWMLDNGFTSSYLHRYVDYCTKDDFGTPHSRISAWAGIHYFAARKGKGANAAYSDVLTWPEGNGFFVRHLKSFCNRQTRTGCLAVKVQQQRDKVIVDYFDSTTNKYISIETEQCILACPQFVAARLLQDKERAAIVKEHFSYSPWMVANMKVGTLKQKPGAPLSWDNVIHESNALGYIDNTHQQLALYRDRRNFTYYLPLCEMSAVQEREKAYARTHEEWVRIILDDLEKVHEDIGDKTEEINVMLWGHAMIQPLPGFIFGGKRKAMPGSGGKRIHFAHTDIAGISIFEEAFYQGLQAAEKLLAKT